MSKGPKESRSKISFVRSSERALRAFLSSYVRVGIQNSDKTCRRSVSASQVTFWIFQDGEWSYGQPNSGSDGGRSWCHSYLASHFEWSDAEYQAMKYALFFSLQYIWTGVYKHKYEAKYAVVYKPFVPLSRGKRAAGIVGGALVGLGIGKLAEKYKKDRRLKKEEVGRKVMEALILTLGTQKDRIKSAMNLNKNKTLETTDLVDFKSYKESAEFAAKKGNGEFLNHVNFIDLLLELKISEAEFEELFKIPQFSDITRTPLFARIADFNGKKAFEAGGDTYSTFQIAREFRELLSRGFEGAYRTNPHFEEMLNLLDTCPLKTLQAVKELAEPPKSLFAGPLPYAVQQYIFGKCDNHGRTLFQIDNNLDRHLEDPNQLKDEETSIERDIGRICHFVSLLNVIKGGRKIENVYDEEDYLLRCSDLTDGVEKAKLKLGRVKLLHRHQMSDEQMHTKIELLLAERNLTQPIDQKVC